jgi:hypothetical protein
MLAQSHPTPPHPTPHYTVLYIKVTAGNQLRESVIGLDDDDDDDEEATNINLGLQLNFDAFDFNSLIK